jgi:curved DNA-binding protein
MDFKDYYKILGVEPTADEKTIKTAYRKLARKYHPDVSKEPGAEDKFKEASEAYEALKSADKRAEYDELRRYTASTVSRFQPTSGLAEPGWRGCCGLWEHGRWPGRPVISRTSSVRSSAIVAPVSVAAKVVNRVAQADRGQDVEMELAIFLEETLSTESKKISFKVPQHSAAMASASAHTSKSLNVKIPGGRHRWRAHSSERARAHRASVAVAKTAICI